ncbi:transposable element Tc1 transposase [Trichonephila clavipes]|nr:transposable element Tc1 transposase [Trichonephila clavipes]
MVWGVISFNSRTPLIVIRNTIVRRRHSENCFATVPFAVPWPYFSENKARPHAVRVAMNCLIAYQILPWLSRSPDLSPIEHIWDVRGRRLHLPGNVDGLTRQLEQIWQEIPHKTIRVLCLFMPYRVAACIQARGG